MKKRKIFSIITLTVVAVVLLCSCGKDSKGSNEVPAGFPAAAEITQCPLCGAPIPVKPDRVAHTGNLVTSSVGINPEQITSPFRKPLKGFGHFLRNLGIMRNHQQSRGAQPVNRFHFFRNPCPPGFSPVHRPLHRSVVPHPL